MEAYRTAYVYVRNNFAGVLKEKDFGYSFVYDNDYLESENPTAVSLTLPLQKEEYTSKIIFPFFDGLIPEGWYLISSAITGKLTVKTDSDYCLLPVKIQ